MKYYIITYWKIGECEQKKICTSLWAAIKLCIKVRKCLKWSIGITHINTMRNLVRAKEIKEFYENIK